MIKKSIKSALSSSLQAEERAVENRFARAENVFREASVELSKQEPAQGEERVIRDSFTLPGADYELIAALKKKCLRAGVNVTKSETIRAGLHALNELSEMDLLRIIGNLKKVKTGRPPQAEK